jgi:hypothetical protein
MGTLSAIVFWFVGIRRTERLVESFDTSPL